MNEEPAWGWVQAFMERPSFHSKFELALPCGSGRFGSGLTCPMKYHSLFPAAAHLLFLFCAAFVVTQTTPSAAGAPQMVFDSKAAGLEIKPSSAQVSFKLENDGIAVTIQPGAENYPGITITQQNGKPFDFSAHGHVQAALSNTGSGQIYVSLRLDNEGDWKTNPYNAEGISIKPGEMEHLEVLFGHSFGRKKSFPLKPGAVSRLLFFSGKSDSVQTFKIHSLIADGPPGELPAQAPEAVRIEPANDGTLFDSGSKVNLEQQIVSKSKVASSSVPGSGIRLVFPANQDSSVSFRPATGRWDLSQCIRVVVRLKNEGLSAISPTLQLESNGGPSDAIMVPSIAPGKSVETSISFISKEPWVGATDAHKPDSKNLNAKPGAKLTSDAVSSVVLSLPKNAAEVKVILETIKADVPPPAPLPEWLGKSPPVKGNWTQTFAEEFEGDAINKEKWNVAAANYWDKASGFSKDNVLVANGVAKLRYDHRTLFHNDDPKEKKFDYATGFLSTYDKWTQRYGYFEARTKLPKAPGLWPAFWLMPDRGKEAGDRGKREDTGNGGMEFDILEHLTRWGPFRYNIAMHWDGYGKEHKAIGSSNIYIQTDKEGFVTTGMLWLPGSVAYYFNGQEVARWESDFISKVPSHMMFTLPQGGWDNNAVDDATLPDDFVVDYVRVWQRGDLK